MGIKLYCPYRLKIMQVNMEVEDETYMGGKKTSLVEQHDFCDCYKEECAAFDDNNFRCRRKD